MTIQLFPPSPGFWFSFRFGEREISLAIAGPTSGSRWFTLIQQLRAARNVVKCNVKSQLHELIPARLLVGFIHSSGPPCG